MYCIPAGWLWNSNGFLKQLGVVDIAGSGGVHLVGGSSGRPQTSRKNTKKTLDLIDNDSFYDITSVQSIEKKY